MPSVALDSAVGDVARSSDSALDHSVGLGDTAWKKQLGETVRPSTPAEKIPPTEKTFGHGTEPGIGHEPADLQAAHDALSPAPPRYEALSSDPPPPYMPSQTEEAVPVKAPESILEEHAAREPAAPVERTPEEETGTQIGHEPTATRRALDDEPHRAGTDDQPSEGARAGAALREVEELRSVGETFTTAITDDTIVEILTMPDDTSRPSTPSKESDTKQREISAIAKAAIAKELGEAMDRRHLDGDPRVS